jgi:hypothetical protein
LIKEIIQIHTNAGTCTVYSSSCTTVGHRDNSLSTGHPIEITPTSMRISTHAIKTQPISNLSISIGTLILLVIISIPSQVIPNRVEFFVSNIADGSLYVHQFLNKIDQMEFSKLTPSIKVQLKLWYKDSLI